MTRISRLYYWLAERLYNELAWIYDPVSWLVSFGQWSTVRRWAVEYIAGSRVLELGFGTGELLLELAGLGYDVIGVELSIAMHKQTVKKLCKQNVSIKRVLSETQHLPFSDNTFDTIISTYPAGYIFDPLTWREVSRVMDTTSKDEKAPYRRFVVVGIGATVSGRGNWVQRRLFKFPLDKVVERCDQLAKSAGLGFNVEIRRHKGLAFPIFLAEA